MTDVRYTIDVLDNQHHFSLGAVAAGEAPIWFAGSRNVHRYVTRSEAEAALNTLRKGYQHICRIGEIMDIL